MGLLRYSKFIPNPEAYWRRKEWREMEDVSILVFDYFCLKAEGRKLL